MTDRRAVTWNFLQAWFEYNNALLNAASLNPGEVSKNPALHQFLTGTGLGTIGKLTSSPEETSDLAVRLALAEISRD